MRAPPSARIGYLDGLRGVAVVAVVASHAVAGRSHAFVGGYVGVDLFFVLSGFVITSLLLRRRTGYPAFVRARVRRLYPPLLALVGITALAGLLVPGAPIDARSAGV